MDQSSVRLPTVFVLELPAANRALECRILAALDSQMFLQRVSPHVLLAALVTPPHFLRGGCKEKSTN